MSDPPSGWEWATVGSVAESLVDGPFGSNLKTEHYQSSGVRVIRLQNIADGFFHDADRVYISADHANTLIRHEARPGDVLIAAMGDVLPRVCLVPSNISRAIVKADCFRLRPNTEVLPEYISYMLSAPQSRKRASTQIAGVGRPRLNLKKVSSLEIPIPPRGVQKRIVATIEEQFSRLDAGYAALRRAKKNTTKITRSVILAAVPEDCPGHWKQVTVDDAGEVKLGRQRSPKYHNGSNMLPYLRVANVFEDRIDTGDIMIMHFEAGEFDRYKLRFGDILLNEGQSPHLLGRPAMYRDEPPDIAFTNSLLRFRAGPSVLPRWALLVFRHHLHSKRFMLESQITTNIAHLSAGRFKGMEFPIPPVPEQEEIAARVEEELSEVAHMATIERYSIPACD